MPPRLKKTNAESIKSYMTRSSATKKVIVEKNSQTKEKEDDMSVSENENRNDSKTYVTSTEMGQITETIVSKFKNVEDLIENRVCSKIEELKTEMKVEIRGIQNEILQIKETVKENEKKIIGNEEKIKCIEETLPQNQNNLLKKIKLLEEEILVKEIHDRKRNLLIYGVKEEKEENIQEVVTHFLLTSLELSKEEVMKIKLCAAHRLRKPAYQNPRTENAPRAIIIVLIEQCHRDRILNVAQEKLNGRSKMSVRSDLPATLKKKRAQLVQKAFEIRKNEHLKTRIRVVKADVWLEVKGKSDIDWNRRYN
ncbi:hypothetical protein SNE40_018276 [Patella caerulea]|uniref:Uncharacterized protein n=2 Tax=Patella caerulea TaxID=87958 RepID=A0AAN8PGX6_PATCE